MQELAEARTALQSSPPLDPAASWETFARDRLDWDAQAAVPVELLYLTYARWCAAYGEPVLAEDHVLAWLTVHGATVSTGPLSQLTTVVGVRVVA